MGKPLVAEANIPLHRFEAEKPFFIVSSGRSGTTLLRRMILETKEVCMPPETYVVGQIVRTHARNPGLTWAELVTLGVGMFEYDNEFDRWGLSLREVARGLCKLPQEEQSVARIPEEIYRHYAKVHGQPTGRWGDKTPKYIFELDHIHRLYPHAKFVHLVRDGVDVVSSILEMGREGYDLQRSAERWRSAVRAFRKFNAANAQLCLELRYEDLVTHAEESFARVCHFLSLSYQRGAIDSTLVPSDVATVAHHQNLKGRISGESIGKGRATLTEHDKAQLQDLMGQELRLLGYTPATI